jgi:hypothetical protein
MRIIQEAKLEVASLRFGIENALWEEARGKLLAYLRMRGSCDGLDQEEYNALKSVIMEFVRRIDDYDIYPTDAKNDD